ncbi:MAG: hypothetical protein ACK46Y_04015 [Fluviicola sp.]
MPEIIANKSFWNHLNFDNENVNEFSVNIPLTEMQYSEFLKGSIPDDISSRYLAYFDNDCFYIHSIMVGACYLELFILQDTKGYYINKIKKYNRYNPQHTLKDTISFIEMFLSTPLIFNK